MIVAVDIGNSNIVIGGIQGSDILFEARLRTDSTKTSDEYAIDLKMIFDIHQVQLSQIEGSIISSVVPQVLNSIKTALWKLTKKNSLVVGPGVKTRLNIKVENPAQTGADLVVGCVGAIQSHKPPLIVIDMGTATTMAGQERRVYRWLHLPRCEDFPRGAYRPHGAAARASAGSAQAGHWPQYRGVYAQRHYVWHGQHD